MQFPLEFAVANLLQDVGVAGLVDFEGLLAVWTGDLVHGWSSPILLDLSATISGTTDTTARDRRDPSTFE